MSNQEETEYKNDNIKVVVNKDHGSKVKLEITIQPHAAKAAYQKAIKAINKEISIPGFRKGKAPEAVVLQTYSQYIDQEWREILANTAFQEALELTKIIPFHQDTIKRPTFKNLSKEEGATLVIEFEAAPMVPEVDTADLKIKTIKPHPITEKQIDQVLEDIRFHHAEWKDITDRPIQEGDFVNLDIEAVEEGKEVCHDTSFEVKEGKMGNWMRNLLIGLKTGESAEGMSEQEPVKGCEACEHHDEEHHHHTHEKAPFKPTLCRITVKSIKDAKLPELNDELAAKTGVKTVEELKERVAASLKNQAEGMIKENYRQQIENQLLEKYHFDLPSSLVESEKEEWIRYRISNLPDIESDPNKAAKFKQIEEEVSREVENSYRLFYLVRKIAEEQKINVSSEEIMQEFMHQSMSRNSEEKVFDTSMDPKIIRSRLFSYLLTRKAKDFLIDKAAKEEASH